MKTKIEINGKVVEITLTPEQVEAITKATEPKCELKGGEFYVTAYGSVGNFEHTIEYAEFGVERNTEELAEQAVKEMRESNRIRALRDELLGQTYTPNISDQNWFIYYNGNKHQYEITYNVGCLCVGAVYMPEHIASTICAMLNSGEFEL